MQPLGDTVVLGLLPWQWAALAAIALGGLGLAAALRALAAAALARQGASAGEAAARDARRFRHAIVPLAHCLAGIFWLRALPFASLPDVPMVLLSGAARLYALVAGAWLGLRLADLAGEKLAHRRGGEASRLDASFGPLVRKAMKAVVVGLAAIFALHGLGIEVKPLWTSLGLGGLAVAFAAKDTIENFFGSIAVLVDRPFEVGDTIAVAGVEGRVQEVGFRSTRLRTSRGTLVTLPNATLVRATVERLGVASSPEIALALRVDAAAPPERLVALRDAVRDAAGALAGGAPGSARARLAALPDGACELQIHAALGRGAGVDDAAARERLLLDALRLAREHGVGLGAGKPPAAPAAPPPPPPEAPLLP